MEYISAKEAAERWGIQVRGVQELCKAGRIQGAFKFERSWMIPASAKKPEDPRRTARKDSRTVSYGDYPSLIAYCTRMSPGSLSGIPIGITSPAAIRQFNAEQLYYTGELDACREMLRSGGADPETLLSRLSLMLPLSICLGETQTFNDTLAALHGLIDQDSGSVCSRAARLLHSCTALGLYMPHFVPEWIKDGQFAGLPSELIPFAIYTRCKYLLAAKRETEAKAAAETALSFFPPDEGFSLIHVYLRLICSAALCATGDMHGCEEHLRETMALALPRGYIIPFAEFLTLHSGLIESVSQQEFPEQNKPHFTSVDALLEELDVLPQPPHHIQRHRHSLEPRAPSRPPAGRRSHLRGGGGEARHERRQREKYGLGHIRQAPYRQQSGAERLRFVIFSAAKKLPKLHFKI